MQSLRVRVYNVRFGDAILISVPEEEGDAIVLRHILIDVGNALGTAGGQDFVFKPILNDIRAQLDGAPVDLYIMTHEHMDHVQGLFYGETKEALPRLPVSNAWITASAEDGYYERQWPKEDGDDKPLKQPGQARLEAAAAYEAGAQFVAALRLAGVTTNPFVDALLNVNNPNSSQDCVDYLRQLAPPANTHYVYRGKDRLDERHPFKTAKLDLWAPEENTAIYYGEFRQVSLGIAAGGEGEPVKLADVDPPPGVDAGAFYRLVAYRRENVFGNLLAIDKAKNNSSVVLFLQWRGWNLLFPGDAEIRSWQEMDKRGQLQPVHFLKISHHASENGTPEDQLFNKLFPLTQPDRRSRVAVASTFDHVYDPIPHPHTLERYQARGVRTYKVHAELEDFSPKDKPDQPPVIGYLDFLFPPDGETISIELGRLALEPGS